MQGVQGHAGPGVKRPATTKEQAVQIGAKALWLQLRIVNFEAARIASEGGLKVVMDRCMKIEHGRYSGSLHWVGMNTEIISARRGQRYF